MIQTWPGIGIVAFDIKRPKQTQCKKSMTILTAWYKVCIIGLDLELRMKSGKSNLLEHSSDIPILNCCLKQVYPRTIMCLLGPTTTQ